VHRTTVVLTGLVSCVLACLLEAQPAAAASFVTATAQSAGIPEPSTALLTMTGLAGLAFSGRPRQDVV